MKKSKEPPFAYDVYTHLIVATPSPLSFKILEELAGEIIRDVPGIVSVTYNIAPKPPSTIEAV